MKKLILLLALLLIPSIAEAEGFAISKEGESFCATYTHTSAIDSAHIVFGYPDTANWYDSVFTYPVAWGSSKLMLGCGLHLDSIGGHAVKIRYYASGSVSGHSIGVWFHDDDTAGPYVGAGSDTLDIIVFDGDTTAVEGVDLCVYNSTKTAKLVPSITTDANGYCQIFADPASLPVYLQRIGVIFTEWDTVTVPSGGGRDTIWVVAYDPGSAPSANVVRLDCSIRGLDGAQYFKEFAEFSISESNVWDTSQTPAVLMSRAPISIRIDTGTVIVDLTPSESMVKVQDRVFVQDSIMWGVQIYQRGRTDLHEYRFYLPDSSGTIHLWDLLKPE